MRDIPSSAIDKHEIHSQEKSLTETKNSLPLECLFKGLLLFRTPLSGIFLERCQIAMKPGVNEMPEQHQNPRIASRRAYLCLTPLDWTRKKPWFPNNTSLNQANDRNLHNFRMEEGLFFDTIFCGLALENVTAEFQFESTDLSCIQQQKQKVACLTMFYPSWAP